MSAQQARAVYEAVTAHLLRKAQDDRDLNIVKDAHLFFVALPERYRTKDHPVLGPVNIDEVIGLRAYYQRNALDWARHWLGLRGFLEVMDYRELNRQQDRGKWPDGCPRAHVVPAARFYSHPSGGEIIVWADDDLPRAGGVDAYTDASHTRRKQVAARPTMLEEGYGAWVEVFYDHSGKALTLSQITGICYEEGVPI